MRTSKAKGKRFFITTHVDRELYEKAKRAAKREDRSVAAVIRRLLSELPDEKAA